jgi:transcriptional regulator with XRE-family HTH domain
VLSRTIDRTFSSVDNTFVPSPVAPETVYKLLGERLARLREKFGVTQEELGYFAGLTRASIANIEKGRQRVLVHQLYEFAESLHVPLVELLPTPGELAKLGLRPEAEAAYLEKVKKYVPPVRDKKSKKE